LIPIKAAARAHAENARARPASGRR